jgi:MFS-type transporter involved in bile tolerance (Atg22 family)
MTATQTAVLALRLGAIYAWYQSLKMLASSAVMLLYQLQTPEVKGQSPIAPAFGYLLPAVILIVAGFILFAGAQRIARSIVPPAEASSETISGITPALAFALVGIIGLLLVFPRLVSISAELLRSEQFNSPNAKQEFLRHLPNLSAVVIETFFCAALIFRSHAFATLWLRNNRNA